MPFDIYATAARRIVRPAAVGAIAAVAICLTLASPPVEAAARSKVASTLDRLKDAGEIDQAGYDYAITTWRDAGRAARKLKGVRRNQLRSTIAIVERIAAGRRLTAGRVRPLFFNLNVNTAWWKVNGPVAAGSRRRFGGSRVIFQYFPGQGWQFHPLANFSRLNAIWADRSKAAAKRALAEYAAELAGLAVSRGGFTTWEYYFTFQGGAPPWISSISQGTAIQALSRAGKTLNDPALTKLATDALGAFEKTPPTGLRVRSGDGDHYLIYSFARRFRVLNAFIQALNGLWDTAEATGDPRARALFEQGDRAARGEAARTDTGAWSLYSLRGRESTLSYHVLLRDFLDGLCARTKTDVYCETGKRFTDYTSEPPRLTKIRAAGRAKRKVTVTFRLSKVSYVLTQIFKDGKPLGGSGATVAYGDRRFTFAAPRKRGVYEIRIEATDLAGNKASERLPLTLKKPKRKRG